MPLIGYFSAGIGRVPHLETFLGAPCQRVRPWRRARLTHIAGWGRKPTADRARRYARQTGLPYVSLEDGFLRSLGLGVNGARCHSLIVDHTGIYYDATGPSDLETLLVQGRFNDRELERARDGMERIRRHRLSKYNHAPDRAVLPPREGDRKRILVVDQTAGDASIEYGLADADTFQRMLHRAVAENPGAEVVVKTHPDVLAGKKQGHLTEQARELGCRLLAEDVSPWALLEAVDEVYVVTSQLGFEALMAGKPVRCFGMPFYAGWGLTRDEQVSPRRGEPRRLEEVFAAAYLRYCRYLNPYTGEPCELEDTIDLLADQRRLTQRLAGTWLGVGLSWRKRRILPRFLGRGARLRFTRSWQRARRTAGAGRRLLAWASAVDPEWAREVERRGAELHRVEDGFIRSVGLGVDLVQPLSLVVDDRGIYYDGTRPSALEALLEEGWFPPELVARAARLRRRLVGLRLSKYNVGAGGEAVGRGRPSHRTPVILVPGQVETDASIATGAVGVRTNRDLLAAVRAAHPRAWIVYKPHPDVLAGGRLGVLAAEADDHSDEWVTDIAMPNLLEGVDEVHTMTSLTGFEALLRGKRVVTYGLPFYAGWGLTEDHATTPRRNRRLERDELVAATLLWYPVYADPDSGDLINAETAVELLARQRQTITRLPLASRIYRRVRRPF